MFHAAAILSNVCFTIPWEFDGFPLLFLYLGPETILPIASILATILGTLMIFWGFIKKMIKKIFRPIKGRLLRRPLEEGSEPTDGISPETHSE